MRYPVRLGPVWAYTVLRVTVFLAVAGLLWLAGVRSWALVFAALVLSLPISLVVLRKPRAEFALLLQSRKRQRMELRAKLRGDDWGADGG